MKSYHYTECGLDNIFLVNGFESMDFEGETVYSVHNTAGLHKAIGENILNKTSLLAGAEIRFLRKEIEMGQKDLAGVLGVKDQSVANYEKNVHKQSQAVDIIIRMQYASKVGVRKNLEDYLGRLALDEIEGNEVQFSEAVDGWETQVCA
jgi:DNA-binding transcriptional regulator YiaG